MRFSEGDLVYVKTNVPVGSVPICAISKYVSYSEDFAWIYHTIETQHHGQVIVRENPFHKPLKIFKGPAN